MIQHSETRNKNMLKGQVLLADNDRDFLNTRAEYLENADYLVMKAYTLEQTRKLLADARIHLAILDIRMIDDDDEKDISGLTLAKDSTFDPVPKIILTGFPSYEYVRDMLSPVSDGLPSAVDFLAKHEGPDAMIQAVDEAFTKYVRINWNLTIRWVGPSSFFNLINFFEPELDSQRLSDRVNELEDLFRTLFYDFTQITVGQLIFQEKGQAIVKGFAHREGDAEKQCIISVGLRQRIKQEDNHYDRFVPKEVSTGSTNKGKTEETIHFAGTTYTLVGGELEDTRTFREFYQSGSREIVQTALDDLFKTTLAHWYDKGKYLDKLEPNHLALSDETISQAEFERRVETLCSEALTAGLTRLDYAPHQLTLHLKDGSQVSFQNPTDHLFQKRIVIDQPVMFGTIHGRLNADNILVNRIGRPWLIYFTQAGQGPLLRDFVSLETAIRLDLLETTNISMRYKMEKRLLTASRLDQAIDTEDLTPEIQKLLHTVHRIRCLASTIIGHDLDSYLTGLLYSAVNYLTNYDPDVGYIRRELAPYLHSLLSAAMLCQTLTPAPQKDLPVQAIRSLLVDNDNQKVWVEGRPVFLSPQEFDLFYYLYKHKGELCRRKTLATEVLKASTDPNMPEVQRKRMEDGILNSTMSRLRKKLEPNPNHPKYIILVRGQGYRLEVKDYSNED